MRTSRPSACFARPGSAAEIAARAGARAIAGGPRTRRASRGLASSSGGSARLLDARRRASSAPRRCSRPCSRAGGGGRRPPPRGTRSPRRGSGRRRGGCRAAASGGRSASRRFQTSRWSPGRTSSARSRLAREAVAVERGGRDDLHHVAAAAREQVGRSSALEREGALDVERRAVDAQARDLGVRRVRLGLDGQRAALRRVTVKR